MLLKDYIPNVSKSYSKIFFSGISFNSSKVKKNNIFFAIKGNKFDGNDYIDEAIKKGAKVIISEKRFASKNSNVIFLHSSNVRKLLSQISYKILRRKPKTLVAITGTNGKSTTKEMVAAIIETKFKTLKTHGNFNNHIGLPLTLLRRRPTQRRVLGYAYPERATCECRTR